MGTLGLFGTLNLGTKSLQTQQMGIETAGHNLSNVNNPAYSRQRIKIETSLTIPSPIGPQGTGAQVVSIQQIRDQILDDQITGEISVSGSLQSQQRALQYAQANLGQQVDRQSSGADAAASATSLSGQYGISEGLTTFFNSFQSVASSPRDATERTVLLENAKSLAAKFNETDSRLQKLTTTLNDSITADLAAANRLLSEVAKLNDEIKDTENRMNGTANDLRDQRHAKIEELSKYVKVDVTHDPSGAENLSIGAVTLVNGKTVTDTLQLYDAGVGQMMVRAATAGTPLTLTGGSVEGTITARDGAIKDLRTDINSLASLFISEVNTLHKTGFGLSGTTGADFFTGTNASNIAVNTTLLNDPQLVQASGVNGAQGNNQVALSIAQLSEKKHASLSNQTFTQSFNRTVADLGQSLSTVNGQIQTQDVVSGMLNRQRDSLMGVSIDEEMTDMIKYQKAYQASARIITTIDEMLDTVLSLKR